MRFARAFLAIGIVACSSTFAFASGGAAGARTAAPMEISGSWLMKDASLVQDEPAQLSSSIYKAVGWYRATVPGTALTTLTDNRVYPDPLYGENMRPIPESLAHTTWWFRTTFNVPDAYAGEHIWLNFDGINFASEVWVNGKLVGTTRGAFKRGIFDISAFVRPGKKSVLAVKVSPQPHPGIPHEHNVKNGVGKNGGESAIDGPTFLSTIGWDWIPEIRDRDTGIWQKVFLSATGPVLISEPLVTTDLPLPSIETVDITLKMKVENISDQSQTGTVRASFGSVAVSRTIELGPHSSKLITFDPSTSPSLHLRHPALWWPNGYGPQNLYKLHLAFDQAGRVSDTSDLQFGVRKVEYSVPNSPNLTISVNGVPIFIRGGNWGLDEAMKRIPRDRLEAQIRLHQLANLNMIRNWVGQSTDQDFYDLCDKYGLLIWDEFFQPNPNDGPDPDDMATYMANVRDKILRFRNHPAIVVWCARNEGYPSQNIDDALKATMAELEPTRLYQSNSADGRGVNSHGPYHWRTPREFYVFNEAFKTEIGSMSVPTLESIHGMMPTKDWETINDDWAQHDFARGAADGDKYPGIVTARYGKVLNLADFVRKAQLMNYEAFRAMYEGRNAQLFEPSTGIITWMSNPAQPSFVWQIYHHDLEPNSALFAVRKAGEPVHIQLNESTGDVEVINNLATPFVGALANLVVYNLNGSKAYEHQFRVEAPASHATKIGKVESPQAVSAVHFVKLDLIDPTRKVISTNLYWRASAEDQDNFTSLNTLPTVAVDAKLQSQTAHGGVVFKLTLHNPAKTVALMTHIQLRRKTSGQRVLPVYYSDNYISLVPGEERTITIETTVKDLGGEAPLIAIDGWNVGVASTDSGIVLNQEAQPLHWPRTDIVTTPE